MSKPNPNTQISVTLDSFLEGEIGVNNLIEAGIKKAENTGLTGEKLNQEVKKNVGEILRNPENWENKDKFEQLMKFLDAKKHEKLMNVPNGVELSLEVRETLGDFLKRVIRSTGKALKIK